MTLEEIIERVQANKIWKEYTVFTSRDVQHLCRYQFDRTRARAAIEKMRREGLIDRKADGRYQRGSLTREWLKKRWRKVSNEELGIVPVRLGLL